MTSPLSFLDHAGLALRLREPSFKFMGPSAPGASTAVSVLDGLPTLSFDLLNRFHILPLSLLPQSSINQAAGQINTGYGKVKGFSSKHN